MPTLLGILLGIALIAVTLFLTGAITVRVKVVVGKITFHDYMANELSQIVREALVFCPQVEYFTRPTDAEGWYALYICKSPDAERFVRSVQAQLDARSIPGSTQEGLPESTG